LVQPKFLFLPALSINKLLKILSDIIPKLAILFLDKCNSHPDFNFKIHLFFTLPINKQLVLAALHKLDPLNG